MTSKELEKAFLKEMQAIEDHNLMIIKKAGITLDDVEELLEGETLYGKIEIVEEPKGKLINEEFTNFDKVYVDQYGPSIIGDDFHGYIYADLDKGWIKIPYQC